MSSAAQPSGAAVRRLLTAIALLGMLTALEAQPPGRSALQTAVDAINVHDMDGRRISMAHLRGRVVLIEFWATWCAPCLADIPWIREAREAHGERFEAIGISLDVVERATFESWLRRHDVTWRQVYDGRGWSSPAVVPFNLDGIPFNLLIDPDGRVVGTNIRGAALLRTLAVLLPAGPERSASSPR